MIHWIANLVHELLKGNEIYICMVPCFYGLFDNIQVRTNHYVVPHDTNPDFNLTPEENIEQNLLSYAAGMDVHDFNYKVSNKLGLHLSVTLYASTEEFSIWRQTAGVINGKIVFESKLYKAVKINSIPMLEKIIEQGKTNAINEFKQLTTKRR